MAKNKNSNINEKVFRTSASATGSSDTLTSFVTKTEDLLSEITDETDVATICKLIVQKHPDAATAAEALISLLNVPYKINFKDLSDKDVTEKYILEWNESAKNFDPLTNMGLDGVLKVLDYNTIVLNGRAFEYVLGKDETLPDVIYPIDASTLQFKKGNNGGRTDWIAYQEDDSGNEVVLTGVANFFWFPNAPKADDPTGTYRLESSIIPIQYKLEMQYNIMGAINKQGYGRDVVEVDSKAILELAKQVSKNKDELLEKYNALAQKTIDQVANTINGLGPNSTLILLDTQKLNPNNSNTQSARSIDTRPIDDFTQRDVTNGLKIMSILLNVVSGQTETWGTVQWMILINRINDELRTKAKIIAKISDFWARVRGYQVNSEVIIDEIDYNSLKQKFEAYNVRNEYYHNAEEYQWISKDEAAIGAVGKVASGETSSENSEE